MTDDRRKSPRLPVKEEATLSDGETVIDATILDVSDGGMGIGFELGRGSDHTLFDIGAEVEVAPKEGQPKAGRVVRHYVNGMGLSFGEKN